MVTQARIRPATRLDVPALVALEEHYFIGNLSASERAGGFISIRHSPDWFARAVDCGGVHVAMTADDRVGGFIAVLAPPLPTDPDLPPIVRAVIELAETVQMNGRPIAAQRYALRGPVCIGAELRGQGVYSAFNAVTRKAYRDQFDIGVLFVAADNERSLHTATDKLGAQSLASFTVDSSRFHFLAFDF